MVDTTTIRIDVRTKAILDRSKIYPRETYDDIIKRWSRKRRWEIKHLYLV